MAVKRYDFDQTRPDQTRPDHYCASFFDDSYAGRKVLVLVPHQDDEINVAANSIQNFIHAGAEVFVAFANSGDYYDWYSFEVRISEAANSLQVLGLDRSHIFCLAFAETLNNSETGHIFYAKDNPITSASGHTETYGAAGFTDFAYLTRKQHSPYTRRNYLQDLKELILHVRADVILAVDFDWHADHRMLSLSFDEVMGEILSRPGNDYLPEVFRRFAYCIGWNGEPDLFSSTFLLSTVRPEPGHTQSYDKKIVGTSYYSWEDRVRFPVPEASRPIFEGNILERALRQHVSQDAFIQAERVINADEVFWRRRTDSLSFRAKVSASSGNAGCAKDFRLLNVSEVDSDTPKWENYLWIPDADDTVKELVFSWDEPQTISLVRLWGNVDGVPLQKVSVSMNTGYSVEAGPLPAEGLPLTLEIPEQQGVTECRIKVLAQGSSESGLAEAEFFAQAEQEAVVRPFIQITSGGNFVYEYDRDPDEQSIPLECYQYRTDAPVSWEVEGSARLEDGRLVFEGSGDVAVTASCEGGLYCRAVFRARSREYMDGLRSRLAAEQKKLNRVKFRVRQKQRFQSYWYMLRKRGIIYTAKQVMSKIIKKLGGSKKR